MFAMLGLGMQEILLLGVLGVLMVAGVLIVLFVVRSAGSSGRVAMLEEENRQLRAELNRDRPEGQ